MKRSKFLSISLVAAAFLSSGAASASSVVAERRLVVVSALETFGQAKYAWLYSFLDASTISLAQSGLAGSYKSISVLADSNGTRSKFVTLLKGLTNLSATKSVDVILSVHGANNRIWFDDASVSMADLKSDISALPKKSKLRLMYSLACYGSTHRDEFLASGFRTAIGARKTNTASASEYPAFLTRWKMGHMVDQIFAMTNADPALAAADAAAYPMGFTDADSVKLIGGWKYLNINGSAQ